MIRLLLTAGIVLLAANSARAQSHCDRIRQAVATYGYEASRQHALANYGKEAVALGDKCLKAGKALPEPKAADKPDRPPRG